MTKNGSRAEPQLLTHREPDDEDPYYDDDPRGQVANEESPVTTGQRQQRRNQIWRRVRRTAYAGTALMIIVPVIAFFVTYQMVDVNNPDDVAREQAKVVTMYYADGKTEMTRIADSGGNRIMLKAGDIPDAVKYAVFSAEDSSFEKNSGFDLVGILRAAVNNVTGGTGGGSGITQQYIKTASGDDDPTLERKWVEVVKSYKMSKTYQKDDILSAYLNTIYFGRGAYGVAAAAKAFYNIDDIKTISKSQAALLAGMIQTPAKANKAEYQLSRWEYVTGRMVANGWMTDAEKKAQPFQPPVPLADTKGAALPAPRKRIPQMAIEELQARGIMTEEKIKRNGYRIVTTIDPLAQNLAEKAVAEVMEGQPANLQTGLVAIDPRTGNVLAYYGGADPNGTDWAATPQEPGSSFKPFDLVGLLKQGKGLGEVYESKERAITPGGKVVRNATNPTCDLCTVEQAMKESLNVVFSEMVFKDVKPAAVAEAAREAGVQSPLDAATNDINIAIGGGATQVSTLDMAAAYSTFASGGVRRLPRMVSQVQDSSGKVIWEAAAQPEYMEQPAFDPDPGKSQKIARNVTQSLLPIPEYSKIGCANGRECAGKTGTHQYGATKDNSKAWMVGYTPQVSAAVSMSGNQSELRLLDAKGKIIFGGGLPGKIWKQFMDSYHKEAGLKKEGFGKYASIGRVEPTEPPSASKPPPSAPPSVPAETTTVTPSTSTDVRPTKPSESDPKPTRPTKPDRTTTTTEPGLPGFPGDNDRGEN